MSTSAHTHHSDSGASDVHAHAHAHAHSHDHDHEHAHSGQLNAEVFDQRIASPETATKTSWQRYYEAIGAELVERRQWIGLTRPPAKDSAGSGSGSGNARPLRLLDYACGGGHASRTLLPFVDEVLGLDVSGRSVAAYNEWAAANGAAPGSMRALQANVMTDEGRRVLAGDECFGFDVAVCLMALHHFVDPQLAIDRLVERLRPGGSLMIVDWNQDGCLLFPKGTKHAASHTVHAVGFGREEMKGFFEAAGLRDCEYQEVLSYTEDGIMAMTRGTKPASS